ncbi:VPLPA-CTERM sorting domain-containing protein [Paracoccus homiensis]|uniref:VPLPA-CTERM protein sorting domain-containing protein n=1 Tax=Paracoccus homiensis TaxID=364199 RepID=A0A1I0GJ09_9RHOB|nr:VPLPA-CTERM sorting domain-containing protein [Paracoccus homiensis]SET70334.1 VPLPA-CTERM protein sorting domain-containing protein [Paracoccus homiensis]
MRFGKFLAAAVAGVLVAGAASAATVVNGGFEDVSGLNKGGLNKGKYGIYESISGWTKATGGGIELQNNATLGNRDANSGNWYVELDSTRNSSMYQDITFSTAGVYAMSFFYAPRTKTPGDNGVSYSIANGSSELVSGLVDGVAPADWMKVTSGSFKVDAGDTLRLTFSAEGISNSLGGFIDDVSIAPVPLPASALLLMGALSGMGIAARRRKSRAA